MSSLSRFPEEPSGVAPQSSLDALHAAARDIFAYSLEHCNIGAAFDRHLHFEGTIPIRDCSRSSNLCASI